MIRLFVLLNLMLGILLVAKAQTIEKDKKELNERLDSLYIDLIQDKQAPDKVLHAEPLYIDLIRDLGARKGEKEWNVGLGILDKSTYDRYEALVEYEFAPINRLGLEIELPFSFYYPTEENGNAPSSLLHSLKLAAQYTFFVSEKLKTSMAIGYIHEFEFVEFAKYGKEDLYKGNIYNPFFIAAKRWGNNFHTLIYTGPSFEQNFVRNSLDFEWEINSNFHYMIPGTRNFIGIEVNQEVSTNGMGMTLRPQMRVGLADNLLVGIVTGIPISRETQRFSSFIRIIYEPGHKQGKHHHHHH